MTPDRDLTTTDRALTAATQAYLRQCIDIAAAVGASVVAGPIYAPVGRLWPLDAGDRRHTVARLIEALRPVADHAARHERPSRARAVEPVRDEPGQHRGAGDGRHRGRRIPRARRVPGHVPPEHRGEGSGGGGRDGRGPHRPCPGLRDGSRDAGRRPVRVGPVRRCACEASYAGPICIESFTAHNASIARAASIWRPLAATQDALAVDGLAFLRPLFQREQRGVPDERSWC